MSEPYSIVSAVNIHKSYGGERGVPAVPVLRGVSLEIPEGAFYALKGSSGSGKTTLLNLIGGLDAPDNGELNVGGVDVSRLTDDQRSTFRLQNIGFVFQFFNLLPNLTVRENIALPLLFIGKSEKESRDEASRLAAEVGLEEKLLRKPTQLSGGEMQRVALARALVHRPRLLLADEPTGNLDSKTGDAILDLIHEVARSHRVTILMATHDDKAARVADRVIHMVDGRIADEA